MSERLDAIACLVLPGKAMADIGTDHAQLPLQLIRDGVVPKAIAGDLRPGPLQHARRHCDAADDNQIELRLGDGLSVLAPGEAATIVLAGMGGSLIERLVEDAPTVVEHTQRLVLQPNTQWPQVREWIGRRGWQLEAETLTFERGQFYVTLALDPKPCEDPMWSDEDLLLGPRLRHTRSPTFLRWLDDRHARLSRALARAQQSSRKIELSTQLGLIERARDQRACKNS